MCGHPSPKSIWAKPHRPWATEWGRTATEISDILPGAKPGHHLVWLTYLPTMASEHLSLPGPGLYGGALFFLVPLKLASALFCSHPSPGTGGAGNEAAKATGCDQLPGLLGTSATPGLREIPTRETWLQAPVQGGTPITLSALKCGV